MSTTAAAKPPAAASASSAAASSAAPQRLEGPVDWYQTLRVAVPDSSVPVIPPATLLAVVSSNGSPSGQPLPLARAGQLVRMCLARGGLEVQPDLSARRISAFLAACAQPSTAPPTAAPCVGGWASGSSSARVDEYTRRMLAGGKGAGSANMPGWLVGRADALLEAGDISGAVADCSAALCEDPECLQAYVVRAACCYQLGERERAASDLAHADRLAGGDVWVQGCFQRVQNEVLFLAGSIAHAIRHG
jgi:hypothetical protein